MKFTIKNHRLAPIGSQLPFVASPNVGGALAPKFIVIHYTASGPDADIARYFSQKSANVAAHLVVCRDGSICQCVPFDKVAWHAGKSRWTGKGGRQYSGLNNSAIGIEIENWGPLKKSGACWVSWTGAPVESQKVIEARHKFGAPDCGWEVFTTVQLETVIAAVQAICAEYAIEDILGHDDIAPGRKSDPGPAWDMATFKAKVKGEAEDGDAVMVVHCPSGLNIRSGAGASFPLVHNMLPDGTKVLVHEASGKWRYVSVLEASGKADFSGWVHGDWLV